MGIVAIQNKSGVPKYKQIVTSIENAIADGVIKKGDKLPSINSIRDKHEVSRDTVLSAFNELKTRGIVQSIAGKGYYVSSESVNVNQKVFLLFDELNAFKEDLYSSFLNALGENIHVDIFFHHFNHDLFNKLIYDNIGNYNYYVIMPANLKNTNQAIEKLPIEKVCILDQIHGELDGYSAIYQNFEHDIFNNLTKGMRLIKNYKKLILLFSEDKQPQGMLKGFKRFVSENNLDFEVISSIRDRMPKEGEVYIIPDDRNLIRIIKKIKEEKLRLGKSIGIISYNDTMLKEIVEGGITTISTDFNKMGARLAQMIINKEQARIENPNNLILRKSL
ncbi:GntR family transcriptional regulator [Snuella sedimenti]|uniref:GntR family transcriptional regulator n=1 Tax=Snuella sedimenti TaxID=2798802 RepID=A0A8J7IYP1_9FLAO|nr:GntR family transcriptional regulator [Snuella sedimenti]MBJ6369835.1 GntR family transcriptional regulator [Snuella sedimenti]